MKTSVSKYFEFEAMHHLPYYDGDCHTPHGHSYKLIVTLSGPLDEGPDSPTLGMVCDFKDLSSVVKRDILDQVDHRNLNSIFPNPTAELMAEAMFRTLGMTFGDLLDSVTLYETRTCWATVSREQ